LTTFDRGELIERDRQMGELEERFGRTLGRRGQVAVIAGPVAAGKSALLEQFTRAVADAGALVLGASASVAERALPLGVIDQLVHSTGLDTAAVGRIAGRLEEIADLAWCGETALGHDDHERAMAVAMREVGRNLFELADDVPLVITVDDVHFADTASQRCLAALIRRLRGTRAMVVLTKGTDTEALHAELGRHWPTRPVRVEPLTASGVAQLLGSVPGLAVTDPTVAEALALTGGSPLLLDALARDSVGDLTLGDSYAQAVRGCLYRCGLTALTVGQVLSLLSDRPSPAMLARFVGATTDSVVRAMDQLDRVGLLDGGRFRSDATQAAVAATVSSDEYSRTHGRIAGFMYAVGEPATAVSRHLVRAERIDADWGPAVLRVAADQVVADGDLEHALACLDVAEPACADERVRAEVVASAARIRWRRNPADAEASLPALVAAVRAGLLTGRAGAVPVRQLLWFGRVADAVELLDVLCGGTDALTSEDASALSGVVLHLAFGYPEHSDRARGLWQALARRNPVAVFSSDGLRAAKVLADVLARGGDENVMTRAERVLHGLTLSDDSLVPAVVALTTLQLAGRIEAAEFWCEALLAAPGCAHAPTWQAVLLVLRSGIAMRRGDLTGAGRDARAALDLISAAGWGMAVGVVLGAIVLAATLTGRHEQAASCLGEPIPAGMLHTPSGLRYLYARGVFYAASDRGRAAVIDFQTCGELMKRLQIDQPELVPWRSKLAREYVTAGRVARAGQLVGEELRLLTDHQHRARGAALRVLAFAGDPKRRVKTLREAVELLQISEDWLEVAGGFVDLSAAQNEAGEVNRARLSARAARHIARQCNAGDLLRSIDPDTPRQDVPVTELPDADLSDAERKVAGLAALGHTNRGIAGRLFVTVSTVEQHLTRVYRKLGVTRRTDLPLNLNNGTHVPSLVLSPDIRPNGTDR
jgi:DNA-binding NarL/FixJ family response regulator